MPNHVTSVITLSGDESRIKAMLEQIKNDEVGIGSVDFNKILPMPESLHMTSGSIEDSAIAVCISAINIIGHRQYLIKIYRAYTIFICFYRLKHSLDTALISGEGYNACYMIRHS